jgi:hypothetical protein
VGRRDVRRRPACHHQRRTQSARGAAGVADSVPAEPHLRKTGRRQADAIRMSSSAPIEACVENLARCSYCRPR